MKKTISVLVPMLLTPAMLVSTAYAAPVNHAHPAKRVVTHQTKKEKVTSAAKAKASSAFNINKVVKETFMAPYRQATVVTSEVVQSPATKAIHVSIKEQEQAQYSKGNLLDLTTTTGSQGDSSVFIGKGGIYEDYGSWQKTAPFTSKDLTIMINAEAKALQNAKVASIKGGHKVIAKLSTPAIESAGQSAMEYMGTVAPPTPQNVQMLFSHSSGTVVVTTMKIRGSEVIQGEQETISIFVPQSVLNKLNGTSLPTVTSSVYGKKKVQQVGISITVHLKTTESYRKVPVKPPKGVFTN